VVKSFKLVVNEREYTVEIGDLSESPLTVVVNGEAYRIELEREAITTVSPAPVVRAAPAQPKAVMPPVAPTPRAKVVAGAVTAPMPCKVLAIMVKEGDQIKTGDALFLIESMKMEITIPAPTDGVIKAIRVALGQTVGQGVVMLEMG